MLSHESFPSCPGAYRFCRNSDGCSYVGASENVRVRVMGSIASLRNGKHSNRPLQSAFNKDGESAFRVELLEKSSSTRGLRAMEMRAYLACSPLFNIATIPTVDYRDI